LPPVGLDFIIFKAATGSWTRSPSGRAGTKVGPAENMPHALPAIDSPEHVKAAEAATRALNRYFFVPMLEGRYDDDYLTQAGRDAPKFTDAEMKIIGAPLDFVGINVYTPRSW